MGRRRSAWTAHQKVQGQAGVTQPGSAVTVPQQLPVVIRLHAPGCSTVVPLQYHTIRSIVTKLPFGAQNCPRTDWHHVWESPVQGMLGGGGDGQANLTANPSTNVAITGRLTRRVNSTIAICFSPTEITYQVGLAQTRAWPAYVLCGDKSSLNDNKSRCPDWFRAWVKAWFGGPYQANGQFPNVCGARPKPDQRRIASATGWGCYHIRSTSQIR